MSLLHFHVISAALFSIGLYGVLARSSAVLVIMAIELMLNAVNINLIGYAVFVDWGHSTGLILAIFVITIAAAEVALALAIILRLSRQRGSVDLDEIDLMKW